MRTSTTATSGLCAPTLRIRSSASPAWPTTSRVLIGPADYLREQLLHSIARKLGLRDEAPSPRTAHQRAEIRAVAARYEDHRRRVGIARQPRRDVEAVDVGQLHVEQHHL